MNKFTNLKKTLIIALSIVLFGSCMKDEEQTPQEPSFYLNFFNGYSSATSITARANEQSLGNLEYGNSGLLQFYVSDNFKLSFTNPTTNQILVENTLLEDPQENAVYTAAVFGKAVPAKYVLLKDLFDVESTEANPRIRFINLAEGTDAVDLYIDDSKVTSQSEREQLTQSTATLHQKFVLGPKAAGGANISLKTSDGVVLKDYPSYEFLANRYYTIVLVGDADEDDSTKGLQIKVYGY